MERRRRVSLRGRALDVLGYRLLHQLQPSHRDVVRPEHAASAPTTTSVSSTSQGRRDRSRATSSTNQISLYGSATYLDSKLDNDYRFAQNIYLPTTGKQFPGSPRWLGAAAGAVRAGPVLCVRATRSTPARSIRHSSTTTISPATRWSISAPATSSPSTDFFKDPTIRANIFNLFSKKYLSLNSGSGSSFKLNSVPIVTPGADQGGRDSDLLRRLADHVRACRSAHRSDAATSIDHEPEHPPRHHLLRVVRGAGDRRLRRDRTADLLRHDVAAHPRTRGRRGARRGAARRRWSTPRTCRLARRSTCSSACRPCVAPRPGGSVGGGVHRRADAS